MDEVTKFIRKQLTIAFSTPVEPKIESKPRKPMECLGTDLNVEEIRELMKCILCETIPVPKDLTICKEGHQVCRSCYILLPEKACPGMITSSSSDTSDLPTTICKLELIPNPLPHYTFVYNKLTHFKCTFSEVGCKTTPLGENVLLHEEMCQYRPTLACAFSECSILLPQIGYFGHLSIVHEIVTFDTNSHRVKVPYYRPNKGIPLDRGKRYRWVCALFDCFGLEFMLVVEEDGYDFRMYVMGISPAAQIQNRRFRWTISFVSLPKARGILSWPGDVLSLSDDFKDDLAADEYVSVQKPTLYKNYIFKTGDLAFWEVDVTIREIINKTEKDGVEVTDESTIP